MGFSRKNTKVVCHSLLQWTTFCQNSPPWPVHLGWPYMPRLSFIESDKAVVHVIRLVSFLWLCFQSLCPLMPSLRSYHLTGVSLILDVGYLLTVTAKDLGHEISPLGHSPLLLLTLVKLCYTKALEWSSLVPGPEAKSSSSEITNPALFTISYQDPDIEQYMKVAAAIKNAIQWYCVIFNLKKEKERRKVLPRHHWLTFEESR